MKVSIVTAIAASLVLCVNVASAQVSPFSDDFALTDGDIAAIDAATDTLFGDPDVGRGSSAEWANDQTGSSGRVTIVDTLKLGNFEDCVRIRYDVRTAGVRETKRFVFDFCEVAEGDWKSYP